MWLGWSSKNEAGGLSDVGRRIAFCGTKRFYYCELSDLSVSLHSHYGGIRKLDAFKDGIYLASSHV